MIQKRILAAALLAVLSVTTAVTTTAEEKEGITATFGFGGMAFDDDREIDGSVMGNIGFGYRFASPWALELSYVNADTETEVGNIDVDVRHWRIDGLYHFWEEGNWSPFFAAGVGRSDIDLPTVLGDSKDMQLNAGIGAKWWFHENSALRGDLRYFRTMDDADVDTGLFFTFHHNFSGTNTAPAPAPVTGPGDADGDGVTDDIDQCPRTPANASVDARGCAIDSDKDGVPDYKDACPGTDQPGARIDSRGCYEMLKETVSVELNVQFDFDSAAARPGHRAEVKRVYDFMRQYPQTKVTIEGHTDSRGSAEYNKNLSQRRANTIAEMLTSDFNVEADRVSAIGYGEERPVASNDTDEGRQDNRRVVGVVEADVETIRKQ